MWHFYDPKEIFETIEAENFWKSDLGTVNKIGTIAADKYARVTS